MYEVAAGFGSGPRGAGRADDGVDTYEVNCRSSSRYRRERGEDETICKRFWALYWHWSRQTVATCDEQPAGRSGKSASAIENEVFASTALMAATPWRVSFDDVKIHVLQEI